MAFELYLKKVKEDIRSSSDVRVHVQNLLWEIAQLKDSLREDISKISDPQGKDLHEVSAEVVGDLEKAFHDFETKNEEGRRMETNYIMLNAMEITP